MKKIFIGAGFLLLLAFIFGTAVLFWYNLQLRPINASSSEEVRFVIPKGQAVSVIARRLEEEGLIRNQLVFRLAAKKNGYETKIQAGSFELSPGMTPLEIAQEMTKGSEDIWVTIPEGLRREEIATLFTEFVDVQEEEFLVLTTGEEGYLFPDTYLFPQAATTEFIVTYLTNTFEMKTKELQAEASRKGQDWEEAVVLASIVQREARTPEQMKQVAGILYNRLEIGQALEVDATLQYVKGLNRQTQKWWSPPLAVDKQLESPYNTYKYPGLPPAPISNPGIDALTAVIHPTPSDNFFYIHAPDGKMYYGENYQEHLENVNRYLR